MQGSGNNDNYSLVSLPPFSFSSFPSPTPVPCRLVSKPCLTVPSESNSPTSDCPAPPGTPSPPPGILQCIVGVSGNTEDPSSAKIKPCGDREVRTLVKTGLEGGLPRVQQAKGQGHAPKMQTSQVADPAQQGEATQRHLDTCTLMQTHILSHVHMCSLSNTCPGQLVAPSRAPHTSGGPALLFSCSEPRQVLEGWRPVLLPASCPHAPSPRGQVYPFKQPSHPLPQRGNISQAPRESPLN